MHDPDSRRGRRASGIVCSGRGTADDAGTGRAGRQEHADAGAATVDAEWGLCMSNAATGWFAGACHAHGKQYMSSESSLNTLLTACLPAALQILVRTWGRRVCMGVTTDHCGVTRGRRPLFPADSDSQLLRVIVHTNSSINHLTPMLPSRHEILKEHAKFSTRRTWNGI